MRGPELTTELLLKAYIHGYFPMAMGHDREGVEWFYPEMRGILPLDRFHIPHSLAKAMRRQPFTITTDKAFPAVIQGCAALSDKRKDTWINQTIIELYTQLWQQGFAHSVECWIKEGTDEASRPTSPEPCSMELPARVASNIKPAADRGTDNSGSNYMLAGGLYGVAIGGAFFGESMFSRRTNASRIALVHLVGLLRKGGYRLLDTQYVNEHLRQFGVMEIARAQYLTLLGEALCVKVKKVF